MRTGRKENMVMVGWVIMVIVILSNSKAAESVRFDIQSGHTKCIAEDINAKSMTVGDYKIVNPNEDQQQPVSESHRVTVRVTSTKGHNYHYANRVESGQFAFEATEGGDYMACFFAADHKLPIIISVDLDWKSGVSAKDWSNVAKKGTVDMMQIELEKLLETVTSVHEEMFYLREREEEMQKLNLSTNARMGILTLLSLVVSLSVAGLQLWHLKTFFEKKKII